jgi:hypothetical protein
VKRPFVHLQKPRSATRRSFLRAVGTAATALPFYRLLEDSFAHAAGEALPLKFMTISHPHGIASEYFGARTPTSPDIMVEGLSLKGSDTETSFDIGYANCSLQPFDDAATYGKSFKDRLLLIEGVDLAYDGHDAVASILTGSRVSGNVPANSSLDQYLAVEMGLGAATLKSSIALAVGSSGTFPASTLSYSKGDYLFSGFVPPDDANARAALARKNALGQSVVDYVREDCNRLRGRLAPVEQQKMDQHLASIRDLEKTFGSLSGQACAAVPKRPLATDFSVDISKLERYNGGEPTFDVMTDFFIDLLAEAFACDVTRFGTLVLNDLPWNSAANAQTDSLGYGLPSEFHNEVAHKYNSYGFDWQGLLAGHGDSSSWLPLAKYNKYVYGKVARFMQKLDERGAFDSTLVYVTSEMGNPALHSSSSVPTVLAGGKNVPFRFGRRLHVTPDCSPPNDSCNPRDVKFASGANNHLLVSIAQAFGVQTDTFGAGLDPAFATGALSGLV